MFLLSFVPGIAVLELLFRYQSMVPDTSFIIIQRGKITAKKSILLIIPMCSKRDGPDLCPFVLYSIFKEIPKLPRHLQCEIILCQIVRASLCQYLRQKNFL